MPALTDTRFRLAVLRTVEDAILQRTGNQIEEAVFLAADGRAVHRKGGGTDTVVWTVDELAELKGRVDLITHNHPRGTSITPEDLEIAMLIGAREVNAFTLSQRYRLYRIVDVWPGRAVIEAAIADLEANLTAQMRARLPAGDITARQAELLYYRVLWTRFAARFAGTVRYTQETR